MEEKEKMMLEKLHEVYPSLYGKNYDQKDMDERFTSLVDKHKQLFKRDDVMLFSAAGRSEIAGNHTDHNLGLVIGATINLDTIACVSKRDDSRVIIASEGFPVVDVDIADLSIKEEERNTTHSLIRGIAKAFKDRGYDVKGYQANTTTRVLKGSGLSSSAAIEVLAAEIFNNLYASDSLSPVELAKIGQYAENVYFGKPSGLLDQISCAHGGIVGIDFKDPKNPVITPIEIDFEEHGYALIITDTKGNHADLTHEYASVPPEMRSVASYFGKENLREVEYSAFIENIADIRKKLNNDRAILRAYHFFKENERVSLMLQELMDESIDTFLMLVEDSGNSSFKYLQNVYPSSSPSEQGLSLALAMSEDVLEGEGASRVHGGGFAGTIQAYVPDYLVEKYVSRMESLFDKGCCTRIAIRKLPVSRIY